MGFPGRLNEKKKPSWMFWGGLVVFVALVGTMVMEVRKVLREPLTPAQSREVYVERQPGIVKKKTDRTADDVNQILHGDPLKHAPERKYSDSAVKYTPRQPKVTDPSSYYGGEK